MIRSLTMRSSGENLWLNIRSSDNTLIQHTYVNNSSYLDEFNVLYMGSDVLYQRSHPYSSTDFYETPFASTLDHLSKQYDSFTLAHRTVPLLHDKAISMAEDSKIAIFCGHAAANRFYISYASYALSAPYREGSTSKKIGILYNTDMYSGNTAIADFSGVDIVIFAGCKTAGTVSSNYNLADSAHRAGAKISIGWTDNTSSELFDWMDYFFAQLHAGNTVFNAKKYADERMEYSSSQTSVIYGDSSFKFS